MKPVVFVPTYNEAPNVARLAAEIRRALPEAVASAPAVDVHHADRAGLGQQPLEYGTQHDVLEHVGEVAGMEGVAVIQSADGRREGLSPG